MVLGFHPVVLVTLRAGAVRELPRIGRENASNLSNSVNLPPSLEHVLEWKGDFYSRAIQRS
jgi:hypothetical protein